jgi:hypothetical protein
LPGFPNSELTHVASSEVGGYNAAQRTHHSEILGLIQSVYDLSSVCEDL